MVGLVVGYEAGEGVGMWWYGWHGDVCCGIEG